MKKQSVIFEHLGRMDYRSAWDYQEKLLSQNVSKKREAAMITAGEAVDGNWDNDTTHHLLFVEHPPVYTLGKSGKIEHILISQKEREERNIQFFHTNRGGDITFHGPGQIVGYPILDLEKIGTDIGKYLRNIEEVMIRTMHVYGLKGERSAGETGVWLDPGIRGKERKICAIGVRCSRWITMHGFAFNVNTDLQYFNGIIPCGIVNKQVTSLQKEIGKQLLLNEVEETVKKKFEEIFDVELIPASVVD